MKRSLFRCLAGGLLCLGLITSLFAQAAPSAIPAPVAQWGLDAPDALGSVPTTITNAVAGKAGLVGQAVYFDGDGDYLSVDHQAVLEPTSFTLGVWFNPADVVSTGARYLIAKNSNETVEGYFGIYRNAANVTALIKGAGQGATYVRTADNPAFKDVLIADTWNFAALTYHNDTKVVSLYLNGKLVGTNTLAAPRALGSGKITLGGRPDNPGSAGMNYKGLIDEVKLFNVALSAEAIASLYAQPLPATWTTPAPVVGLTSAVTDGNLVLTWKPSPEADVLGYWLYQNGQRVSGKLISTPTYTVTNLVDSQSYSFTVTAVTKNLKESAPATPVSLVYKDTLAPATPVGALAIGGNQSSLISWDANTEADLASYAVYQDGTKVAKDLTVRSFTATGLKNGQSYRFTVTATDKYGNESAPTPVLAAVARDLKLQAQYFVATNGNDATGDGTQAKPFATLTAARNALRMVKAGMKSDITVFVRGGQYDLSEPLVFTELDSGANGFTIHYAAYQNEKVILSGGQMVSGWTKVAGTNLFKAMVNQANVRQLYLGGERRPVARSAQTLTADDFIQDPKTKEYVALVLPASAIPAKLEARGLEFYYPEVQWKSAYLPVDKIEALSATKVKVSFVGKIFNTAFASNAPTGLSTPFYLQNAQALIDQPGEWSFNPATKEIFYLPKAGEDLAKVQAIIGVQEQLINLKGTSLAAKVANLAFENLNLEYATWQAPSVSGYFPLQAQWLQFPQGQEFGMTPAAIRVNNADNLVFTGNTLRNCSAVGIGMFTGVSNVTLKGNVFTQLGDSAITLGTTSQGSATIDNGLSYNVSISNNVIYKIGQDYASAPGIQGYFAKRVTIDHNDFEMLPYTAIAMGWNWTNKVVTMEGLKISNNLIRNVSQILKDGGGIYTLGRMPNAWINDNYVDGVWREQGGIYLDQGTTLAIVENNVVRNVDNAYFYKNSENIVRNTYSTTAMVKEEVKKQLKLDDANIKFPFASVDAPLVSSDTAWPAEAKAIIAAAGLEPAYQKLRATVMSTAANKAPQVAVTKAYSVQLGQVVSLKGSVSDDALPYGMLQLKWSVTSAPEGTMVKQPSIGATICKAVEFLDAEHFDTTHLVFSVPGTYVLALTAHDGSVATQESLTFTVTDNPTTAKLTNVALGKLAAASTQYNQDFGAASLVDGKIETEWAANPVATMVDWVSVDLGKAYSLKEIQLVNRQVYDFGANRSRFLVQVSNSPDFSEVQTLATVGFAGLPFQSTLIRPVDLPQAYRYVRVLSGVPGGVGLVFAELRVMSE